MWLFTHFIWKCLTLLWITYQISKKNRLILFWRIGIGRNHPKRLTPANLRGQRSDFETSFLMALHLSLLITPIVHCYPLYQALWSFIERGGSKLLIEMGQRGSSGCKFILIPQRDVRDYSRAPSWLQGLLASYNLTFGRHSWSCLYLSNTQNLLFLLLKLFFFLLK